ncbi:hypothetical protein B0J12DRAFT_671721 [Macrophomina phaseolina]|uniref:Uncharacterized protein n=1 Tax=Macrophomina phaseolina TaxID=35725 RepID=A0ABQ8G471_9PEZI|nr:hypothetical protein B0J12DRAFT_671721 [Macrophomina phaseolina]
MPKLCTSCASAAQKALPPPGPGRSACLRWLDRARTANHHHRPHPFHPTASPRLPVLPAPHKLPGRGRRRRACRTTLHLRRKLRRYLVERRAASESGCQRQRTGPKAPRVSSGQHMGDVHHGLVMRTEHLERHGSSTTSAHTRRPARRRVPTACKLSLPARGSAPGLTTSTRLLYIAAQPARTANCCGKRRRESRAPHSALRDDGRTPPAAGFGGRAGRSALASLWLALNTSLGCSRCARGQPFVSDVSLVTSARRLPCHVFLDHNRCATGRRRRAARPQGAPPGACSAACLAPVRQDM